VEEEEGEEEEEEEEESVLVVEKMKNKRKKRTDEKDKKRGQKKGNTEAEMEEEEEEGGGEEEEGEEGGRGRGMRRLRICASGVRWRGCSGGLLTGIRTRAGARVGSARSMLLRYILFLAPSSLPPSHVLYVCVW